MRGEQGAVTALAAVAATPDAPFEFQEVEVLPPRADEVRVRIVATGTCHTDVAVKEQSVQLPLPMVLGPLGCGLTTGVGTVLNALKPPAGSSIAVFGAGTVGLAAVMGARLSGCARIICVDVRPARLAMAEAVGATDVVNAAEEDATEAILGRIPCGVGFSAECSGVAEAVAAAVRCLGRPGWCAQVGATPAGT